MSDFMKMNMKCSDGKNRVTECTFEPGFDGTTVEDSKIATLQANIRALEGNIKTLSVRIGDLEDKVNG